MKKYGLFYYLCFVNWEILILLFDLNLLLIEYLDYRYERIFLVKVIIDNL